MELQEIAKKVFGKEYKILCKTNKKVFLGETRDWMKELLIELNDPEPERSSVVSSTTLASEFSHSVAENYHHPGRIGTLEVGFTLDKSFGIVAINQDGLNITAACRFATVSASCGVFSGKWMYELHLISNGIMQLGWCTNLCNFSIDRGCGDTDNSYAYDGSRHRSWNMISDEYGELWKVGDVIGLCIDLDRATIEFYRNGRPLGTAFRHISVGAGIIYIPCVSLVDTENIIANFGGKPFRHPIPEYQPLQKRPTGKIKMTEFLLRWMKNLTSMMTPSEPSVLKCQTHGDISDDLFWNRMYHAICYHLNGLLINEYCLYNNFLPLIADVVGVKNEKDLMHLERFHRIMDNIWMYFRERNLDKILYSIFTHMVCSFKQVSESINCQSKIKDLKMCWALISHETTRKYVITNLIDHKFELLKLMHHKPAEEQFLDEFVGEPWWDTKGEIPDVEKNKKSFRNAFVKIERMYDELELYQCKFLKLLMINDDEKEYEGSSRLMFTRKFRKFCWNELEYARSDLRSKLDSHIAYASFQRFVRVLDDLWKDEVGDEPIYVPIQYFYDRTFSYPNCDRIGGLESYLLRTLREELMSELGESHALFTSRPGQTSPSMLPITELRAIVNLLEGNDSAMENFLLPIPTTSNATGPIIQAILTPLLRDAHYDNEMNVKDSRTSLLEFFENLIMFFSSSASKHCHKFSNSQSNLQKFSSDYNIMYSSYRRMKYTLDKNDPIIITLKTSMELLKKDLQKRAKKNAWIESILLSPSRSKDIVLIFQSLVETVIRAEEHGELFVFLPDFYLEACYSFVYTIIRDFNWLKNSPPGLDEVVPLLIRVAELMIRLMNDTRIKHIDSRKVPINTISVYATNPQAMRLLESVKPECAKLLITKLLEPYTDRHWKATNWILVRFWHGSGYGFRYSTLPHHSMDSEYLNPPAYTMYNIACSPSTFYQAIVYIHLMDQSSTIPTLIDSVISELHWTFGEFLTPMQELHRAIERNEHLLMMSRLYKMCSTYFDKTIALLRVIDMFISMAPEIFLESYYPESISFTKRIVQVVLLVIHRISTRQGCFRIVMNSRIAVLENVEYFPIQSACLAILLAIVKNEMDAFDEDDLVVPKFCRMILMDPSFDFENLKILIGSPETRNSSVICLHDYEDVLITKDELEKAILLLKMMSTYQPMISALQIIPDDELCMICYLAPFDVKFYPCGHNSCLYALTKSCISYYISRNRQCFFCKRTIVQVIRIDNDEVVESLTEKPAPSK